jgi:hypothetical protein
MIGLRINNDDLSLDTNIIYLFFFIFILYNLFILNTIYIQL